MSVKSIRRYNNNDATTTIEVILTVTKNDNDYCDDNDDLKTYGDKWE